MLLSGSLAAARAQRGQQVALRVDEDPHRALPGLIGPPEYPVLIKVGLGVVAVQLPAGRGMIRRESAGAHREQRALQGLDRLGEAGGPLRSAAGQVDQQPTCGVSSGGGEKITQPREGFLFRRIYDSTQCLDDVLLLINPRLQARLPRPARLQCRAPLGQLDEQRRRIGQYEIVRTQRKSLACSSSRQTG